MLAPLSPVPADTSGQLSAASATAVDGMVASDPLAALWLAQGPLEETSSFEDILASVGPAVHEIEVVVSQGTEADGAQTSAQLSSESAGATPAIATPSVPSPSSPVPATAVPPGPVNRSVQTATTENADLVSPTPFAKDGDLLGPDAASLPENTPSQSDVARPLVAAPAQSAPSMGTTDADLTQQSGNPQVDGIQTDSLGDAPLSDASRFASQEHAGNGAGSDQDAPGPSPERPPGPLEQVTSGDAPPRPMESPVQVTSPDALQLQPLPAPVVAAGTDAAQGPSATPATASVEVLSPNHATAVLQQVSDHFVAARQSLSNGQASLEITLDPPELGRITIELTETDEQVAAKLIVSEPMTLESIKQSVPSMMDALADAGIDVNDFQLESYVQDNLSEEDQEGSDIEGVESHAEPAAAPRRGRAGGIDVLA